MSTSQEGEEFKMEIKPFRAFRFDGEVVGDAADCISPPYDVIDAEQQQRLYEKNPHNIVRIIQGKTAASDSDTENQYTRAADFFNAWIKEGALKQDPTEAIYPYIQDFQMGDTQFQRISFIALAKIEELGSGVKPHEQTMNKHKADRLNLQLATNANLGLVFMLYKDEERIADEVCENASKQKPLIDLTDEQNVRHRLFTVTDQKDIDAIEKMMLDKSCIIADGHHRYETALNYYKQTGNPAAGYQMLAFANSCNEGLVVLATHRLVKNLENFDSQKLLADLGNSFEITTYKFDTPKDKAVAKQTMLTQIKASSEDREIAFGVYAGNNCFYEIVLKDKKAMEKIVPDKSDAWQSLDVSVLHKLILENLLGIDEQKLAAGTNLEYAKDTPSAIDDSIAKVDSGKVQAAFFVNPEKMENIRMVTDKGEKMPQKSTYFYPKVYTGLTINKL